MPSKTHSNFDSRGLVKIDCPTPISDLRSSGMEPHIRTMNTRSLFAGIASLLLMVAAMASPAIAQPIIPEEPSSGGTPEPEKILIDGIAAVVGDQIILISDVVQQAALEASSRGGAPQLPGPEVLQDVLDELIVNKLLYVKALEDSIEVGDQILNQQIDDYVGRLVARAGSESALETATGKTMSEVRASVRPIVNEQLTVEILRRRRFTEQKVTSRDIEAFYREYRDSLPSVPEQVELAHIFLKAEASESSKRAARELAERIADSIRDGGIFGEYARRYSIDPGSGSKGGELGWVPYGKFVSEYEKSVDTLGINEISGPVESKFGYHIIQLLDKEENRFRSRHILVPIVPSDDEVAAIVDSLNTLRQRALSGESFGQLASLYSDDPDSRVRDGLLARLPTSELGPYRWVIDDLAPGDISDPRPLQTTPTESGYHILKLVRIIPPHPFDPVADRDQLEPIVARRKQTEEILAWIEELRKTIYWEVMHDFRQGG